MAEETRPLVPGEQNTAATIPRQTYCIAHMTNEWACEGGRGPDILLLYFIKILQPISSFTRILETVFWRFQQIF